MDNKHYIFYSNDRKNPNDVTNYTFSTVERGDRESVLFDSFSTIVVSLVSSVVSLFVVVFGFLPPPQIKARAVNIRCPPFWTFGKSPLPFLIPKPAPTPTTSPLFESDAASPPFLLLLSELWPLGDCNRRRERELPLGLRRALRLRSREVKLTLRPCRKGRWRKRATEQAGTQEQTMPIEYSRIL